jgi:hypothetical protein
MDTLALTQDEIAVHNAALDKAADAVSRALVTRPKLARAVKQTIEVLKVEEPSS